MKNETIAKIGATAEVMGSQLSESGLILMVEDLESYSDEDIIHALKRMRRDGTRFTVAEIVKRLPGMWPGAEQAWAMFPKSEMETACLTGEMLIAGGAAEDLDDIAGRMTFKEVYNRLVSEALAEGRKPDWQMTIGRDVGMREEATLQAVKKGLLSVERAKIHLPSYSPDELQQLADKRTGVSALLTHERRRESAEVPKMLANALSDDSPADRETSLAQIKKLKALLSVEPGEAA